MNKLAELMQAARDAFAMPTLKQKEAYGRYCHTLSAACVVGGVTVIFTETQVGPHTMLRILALAFNAVLLFVAGATMSKGE